MVRPADDRGMRMAPNSTISSVQFTIGSTNPFAMTGDEFRALRKAIPMKTEELAAWLGVTRMTIFRWEKGRHRVPAAIASTMRDAVLCLSDEDVAQMERSA